MFCKSNTNPQKKGNKGILKQHEKDFFKDLVDKKSKIAIFAPCF